MVSDGSEQDPEDDRHRTQEARGEHQGEDVPLVADLGEADHDGRHEKSLHRSAVGVGREMNLGTAPSAQPGYGEPMPKGLAKPLGPLVPWPKAKRVDTSSASNADDYSPMTGDS